MTIDRSNFNRIVFSQEGMNVEHYYDEVIGEDLLKVWTDDIPEKDALVLNDHRIYALALMLAALYPAALDAADETIDSADGGAS